MVLDEVDKLSVSYNGDPASALLEVLDPEQNGTFTDHYMNVPYDLSDVLFICTANSLDTIPEPLLNRMEVIRFTGYTASDKFQIAKRHLLPKSMKAMGITEEQIVIPDEIIRKIIDNYTMESGVRGLRKRLDTLCRSARSERRQWRQRRLRQPRRKRQIVLRNPLIRQMDRLMFRHRRQPCLSTVIRSSSKKRTCARCWTRNRSGTTVFWQRRSPVVTGLAWTAAGGEILFIETLFTKGSGKFSVTGQLGDVMKESVQIAVSLVKSMFPDKVSLFEENDLHIHVPEGAVPKDGPSAGITMTTALASLVSGNAVAPTIAMTGEVSLRGVVTPIGGLPEKLMAASRAGIQTVFIPAENEDDLDEVPQEVKDKLTIIPVADVTEVLKKTGILEG